MTYWCQKHINCPRQDCAECLKRKYVFPPLTEIIVDVRKHRIWKESGGGTEQWDERKYNALTAGE